MKFFTSFYIAFLFGCSSLHSQNYVSDSIVISRISDHMLEKSDCYYDLEYLCKKIGHRISGSPSAAKAVEWGKKTLEKAGCDRVYLQPIKVPHWVRSSESFSVTLSGNKKMDFHPLGLGNSMGTNGSSLSAEIIEVSDEKELERLGKEKIQGKILFFNHAWNQKKISPFHEYGGCVYYRWAGPSLAAKYGAVGCIIRSAGSAYDQYAHTGSMVYDSAYPKIPAMALGWEESLQLSQLIKKNSSVLGVINSKSHFEEDKPSANVVGELIGAEFPDEIITIGGHLDSWDVGEGAHDDGAGVVQCIDVLRTLKLLGIRPKRTIRCVLFMNEENGLRGGTEYTRLAKEKKEKHILAIETDAGGFSPRGFNLTMSEVQKAKVLKFYKLFYALGVYNFDEKGGGADIGPLNKEMQVPLMGLLPDPQRYFDLHHTENDVFEQVNRRELSLGAASIAAMAWLISEYGI